MRDKSSLYRVTVDYFESTRKNLVFFYYNIDFTKHDVKNTYFQNERKPIITIPTKVV